MIDKDDVRLSELLFDEKRYKLLNFLLNNSDESYSIVEISSQNDVSRQFASNFVEKLAEVGLVDKRKKGNMYLISFNRDSAYYDSLKQILEIDSKPLRKKAEDFAEYISENYEGISTLILYGSVARGVPTLDSDVDILVVTEDELDEVVEQRLDDEISAEAGGYNKKHNISISLTFYSKNRFKRDLKASVAFIENVVDEGEILAGEKFWQQKS